MLDGWKNSASNRKEVAVLVKPRGEKEIFIASYDFTDISENTDHLAEILSDASEKSLEQYNIICDSICTDNANNVRAGARTMNVVDYGYKAHIGNLMLGDMANKKLKSDVREIIVCFRKSGLQDRITRLGGIKLYYAGITRWKGEKEELECFLKNFEFIKTVAANATSLEVPKDIQNFLSSRTIVDKVKKEISIHAPVCEYIDKIQSRGSTLADSVELWMEVPKKFEAQKKNSRRASI